MMRLAFYAPMESPDHQFPSVDGKIARKLIKVLRLGGNIVSIASHFQSYNDTGQSDRLESIRIAGKCHANNIIEEILVNAIDNWSRVKQRNLTLKRSKKLKPVTRIEINMDQETGQISITNNGEGIDVALHPTEKIYIPQKIINLSFCHWKNYRFNKKVASILI